MVYGKGLYKSALNFTRSPFYLIIRPRGLPIALARLERRLLALPLVELPRADGRRDWRGAGILRLRLGAVDSGGLSTNDTSVAVVLFSC